MTAPLHPVVTENPGMLVSFVACVLALAIMSRLAPWFGLLDNPDGARKLHGAPVALTGGIAILLGLLSGAYASGALASNLLLLVFLGIVTGLHLLDDRYGLPASLRLAADGVLALAFILLVGSAITSLGEIGGVALPLGALALPFTVLVYLALSNAFNMIDGVDGLCITQILASILLIGFWRAAHADMPPLDPLTISLFAACLAALLANTGLLGRRLRCFLGDSGARLLGFFLATLIVTESSDSLTAIAALFFVAVPVLDMGTVAIERLRAGLSPMAGDRRHLHHLLFDAGLDRRIVVLTIGVLSLVFGVMPFLLQLAEVGQIHGWALFAAAAAFYGRGRRPLARALAAAWGATAHSRAADADQGGAGA